MAPFPRRPARRTRPLPRHTTDTSSISSKSHASNAAAGHKLRRYGGLAALGLAAVFLLSGDNDGLSSHPRRQLRVLDGANVQELLARPVDLPYDPTNPFLSRGERNLKSASSKGWSVGDVFSRSSAGDYNDDGSDASGHRSLSSGSDAASSGRWFSWGGNTGSSSFGGLGDDLRSIQDALDAVIFPSRRFLAKWNEGGKRYLYEWTDGVTREAVGEGEEEEVAEQDASDPRPIMHTFFDAISSKGLEDELALVAAWEAAWQSAGWRTRVLTSDDARRHFQYDELWPLIDEMPLIQYDKQVPSCCCIYLYSCTFVLSLTFIYDCVPFLLSSSLHLTLSQAVLSAMARHGCRRRWMDERLRHGAAPRIAGECCRSELSADLYRVRAEFERRLGTGSPEWECQRVEPHGQRSGEVGTHGSGGGGKIPISQ